MISKRLKKVGTDNFRLIIVVYDLSLRGLIPRDGAKKESAELAQK
jgi:hypothetical protein